MSHSRILKKIIDFTDKRSKQLNQYYVDEGLIKGTAHSIKDDFERPWKFAFKRKHVASEVAMIPVAAVDSVLRASTLIVTAPISVGLFYNNHITMKRLGKYADEGLITGTLHKMKDEKHQNKEHESPRPK